MKNIFVLGDINVLNETVSREYLFLMPSFGLISYVNTVTRPTSKTCLDHVFGKTLSNVYIETNVVQYNIADHSLISCDLCYNFPYTTFESDAIYKHIINYTKLIRFLENDVWINVYNANNPKVLTSHISKKKYTKIQPWISHDLIQKISEKSI